MLSSRIRNEDVFVKEAVMGRNEFFETTKRNALLSTRQWLERVLRAQG
jgi:hypothetical protein